MSCYSICDNRYDLVTTWSQETINKVLHLNKHVYYTKTTLHLKKVSNLPRGYREFKFPSFWVKCLYLYKVISVWE